jgi:hypothetical protein
VPDRQDVLLNDEVRRGDTPAEPASRLLADPGALLPMMPAMPGPVVLMPVLVASAYVAYKDICLDTGA